MSFPSVGAVPGGKPFETSRKGLGIKLRRRKHGTTDRLALPHQNRLEGEIAETVRSAPGRDPRMPRVIRILAVMAREGRAKPQQKDRREAGPNDRAIPSVVEAEPANVLVNFMLWVKVPAGKLFSLELQEHK